MISVPTCLQSLLNRFNITELPNSCNDVITTSTRKKAINNLVGLIHSGTIQVLYKTLITQFSHFIQERNSDYWDGEYYYLPQSYLNKKYGSSVRKIISEELVCLEELGLVKISRYIKGEKCKGYKVIFPQLLEAFEQPISLSTEKVFLSLSNNNKKPIEQSEIAKQMAKNIPIGHMNFKALCENLTDRLPSANESNLDYLLVELRNILCNWINRVSYDSKTHLVTYNQAYHTTELGGRSHSSSGEQYASRELKTAWFDFDNVKNYDIKACHISIFNQINPTTFADRYISDGSFKQQLSEKTNIPVSILKQSILALLYGGKIVTNDKCAIFKLFHNYFEDYEVAKTHLELFKAETIEFRLAISEWMKHIEANPKQYQKNQLGLRTDSTDPQSLASHYLTGVEQSAIHWISSPYNQRRGKYQAISNQYDGLVTIGSIPDDILALFSDKFGLSLAIKPFI
jgi:hypothetical protein